MGNKDPSRFRSTIGILGPACSNTIEPIAGVSKHYRTVVISYGAEGSISNSVSEDFPYFFRTIAENKQYKHANLAALKKFGWKKVAALTQDGSKYSHYMSSLQDVFQENGIDFVLNRKFPRDTTDMSLYLEDLKERGAKVIIADFYEAAARHIMCQAYKLSMTQAEGYVWFLPGWYKEGWYDLDNMKEKQNPNENNTNDDDEELTALKYPPDCTTREMLQALNGAFSLVHNNYAPDESFTVGNISVAEWRGNLKKELDKRMKVWLLKERSKSFDFEDGNKPNKYSGYVYDAVWLYALALDKLMKVDKALVQDLHSEKAMAAFVKIIKEQDFQGVSGRINFHDGHSRLSEIGTPHMATIMILDDDHSGIFGFEDSEAEVVESVGTYELQVKRISGARGKVAIPYNTEDGTAKEGTHYEAQEGELMYDNEETTKVISIAITDEESYEKSLIMYVEIGEPRHIAEGKEGEGVDYSELDGKTPEELTEEEKIALLGRPCLGANTRIQIRIKESKEFKNSVDKMMQKANHSMMAGSSSWLEQFSDAFTVRAEDDDEEGEEGEEAEEKMPSCGDYIMHFLTLPWKLIFAFIPPTAIYGGYPTFVIAILFIGGCTAIIGDVAGHLGCFINLKDCVNAIAFVALGTSVPDTFASKTAAIEDETADASVGNVTGSNAVNVFLGIGIAWTMAAVYWEAQGLAFIVPVGSLGFSVTIFCIEAVLAILILLLRRNPAVGGELGGPKLFKTISSSIFVFFWVFYVLISALEAYKVIDPGF